MLTIEEWIKTVKLPPPTDPGPAPCEVPEDIRTEQSTGAWYNRMRDWKDSPEGQAYKEWEQAKRDFSFYTQWDYEQFVINRMGRSVEQLCILFSRDYYEWVIGKELAEFDGDVQAWMQTKQLVVANHSLHPFLQTTVAKGWVGLWVGGSADDPICTFPVWYGPTMFGSVVKIQCHTHVIESWRGNREPDVSMLWHSTGAPYLYTSDRDMWERSEVRAITRLTWAARRWCFIRDERWFVAAVNCDSSIADTGKGNMIVSPTQVKVAETPTDQFRKHEPVWRGKKMDIYVPPRHFYRDHPIPDGWKILDVHIDDVLIDEPRIAPER